MLAELLLSLALSHATVEIFNLLGIFYWIDWTVTYAGYGTKRLDELLIDGRIAETASRTSRPSRKADLDVCYLIQQRRYCA